MHLVSRLTKVLSTWFFKIFYIHIICMLINSPFNFSGCTSNIIWCFLIGSLVKSRVVRGLVLWINRKVIITFCALPSIDHSLSVAVYWWCDLVCVTSNMWGDRGGRHRSVRTLVATPSSRCTASLPSSWVSMCCSCWVSWDFCQFWFA